MNEKEVFPARLLIIGTIFILGGSLLLLWTSASITYTELLWPLFLILPGLGFLYKAFVRNGTESHTIPGTFFTLLGIYFLLSNTVLPENELEKIWPIFMFITGISMLPYGIGKKRGIKVKILVPAGAIITMSLFFLPFTLKLLTIRFISFVTRWWPVLFIILGLIFLTIYYTKMYTLRKK
jgi:hypothetical protein